MKGKSMKTLVIVAIIGGFIWLTLKTEAAVGKYKVGDWFIYKSLPYEPASLYKVTEVHIPDYYGVERYTLDGSTFLGTGQVNMKSVDDTAVRA